MTRARHVTPFATAERLERMRTLITTLQLRPLTISDIGALLQIGPSGARKYLVDLSGKVQRMLGAEELTYRLTLDAGQAAAFLTDLAMQAAARPKAGRISDLDKAARDPSRQFHIVADDKHYAVRLHRGPVGRDPLVAALFGAGKVAMEIRV